MIANKNKDRAGQYTAQIGGYKAFIPNSLPPDPPIKLDNELLQLHSQADIAVGRLSGTSEMLPIREFHRDIIVKNFSRSSGHAYQLLEYLYRRPIITVNSTMKATGISYANANKLVTKFQEHGILREMTHIRRNRRFAYAEYLALFASEDELQGKFTISAEQEEI